jgi:rubrerythrin
MVMSKRQQEIKAMLRVALTTTANHYQYYHKAAMGAETPKVKALLMVLADEEAELMDRVRDMLATGITEELEELSQTYKPENLPNEMPFDLSREETDPRIYVCNQALKNEVKGYTFFLSIAARAKSEIISRLFEYFAYRKMGQMKKIRRVCETF